MKVYSLTGLLENPDCAPERYSIGVYKTLKEAQAVMADWKSALNPNQVKWMERAEESDSDIEIETLSHFFRWYSPNQEIYWEQGIDEFEI